MKVEKILDFGYNTKAHQFIYHKYDDGDDDGGGYYIYDTSGEIEYIDNEVYIKDRENTIIDGVSYDCLYYIGVGNYILEKNLIRYFETYRFNIYKYNIMLVSDWMIKKLLE